MWYTAYVMVESDTIRILVTHCIYCVNEHNLDSRAQSSNPEK